MKDPYQMEHLYSDYRFKELSERMKVLGQLMHENAQASFSMTWSAQNLTDPEHFDEKFEYDQREAQRCRKAMDALCATLAYQSFNDKDGEIVALKFEPFYRQLPVDTCKDDDNPNNGKALWNVEIPDDATILISYDEYCFDNKSKIDKEELEKIANTFGRSVRADEISVECETRKIPSCTVAEWRIRFWWD